MTLNDIVNDIAALWTKIVEIEIGLSKYTTNIHTIATSENSENSEAAFDLASNVNENSDAIYDIAAVLADFEDRISRLEEQKEE